MNIRVRVRPKTDPPVWELDEGGSSKTLLTRIYMGAVGPVGREPGYVCVVGEEYDGDYRQKPRRKIVLDEAHALDPADFGDRDRERYSTILYFGEGRKRVDLPTLYDLKNAAIALKDLYRPEYCYVPPNDSQFAQDLQATEGFGRGYSDQHDEDQFREWYPFFRHRGAVMPVSCQSPKMSGAGTYDEEYAQQLAESLAARDELMANEHCVLFTNSALNNPTRAVGLVCLWMEKIDWTWRIREIKESDGYTDPDTLKRDERRSARQRQEERVTLYQSGIPMAYLEPVEEYGRLADFLTSEERETF